MASVVVFELYRTCSRSLSGCIGHGFFLVLECLFDAQNGKLVFIGRAFCSLKDIELYGIAGYIHSIGGRQAMRYEVFYTTMSFLGSEQQVHGEHVLSK
jgi:hypothetical protein